jgi:hypothetical protein
MLASSERFGSSAKRAAAGVAINSASSVVRKGRRSVPFMLCALLARVLDEDVLIAHDHLAGQTPLGWRDVVDVHLLDLRLGDVAEFGQCCYFANI